MPTSLYLFFSATTTAAAEFFGEEVREQLAGVLPVVAVDAVSHLGRLDSALDESRILEFLEVLAHGSLGNGQFVVDVAEVAFLLPGQELQYLYPRRMGEGFGEARYLLRLEAIIFFDVHGRPVVYIGDKNH